MPTTRFLLNGIEMAVSTNEHPLTDAENFQLEKRQRLTKWHKVLESIAAAAAVLSALVGVLSGNRNMGHLCDVLAIALGMVALAIKRASKREEEKLHPETSGVSLSGTAPAQTSLHSSRIE